MAESEFTGFVIAVVFLVFLSTFLLTMPVDMQGEGATPNVVTPINPSLISDFNEAENWTKSDYSQVITTYFYDYDNLGGLDWRTTYTGEANLRIGAKDKLGGILWLGALVYAEFKSEGGTDRGTTLSLSEIESDATDGAVRYTLTLENGNTAGSFVVYWNETLYTDPYDAWDNDALYLVHGIGLTTNTNIATLLLSLLFLQLPDCPLLINVLIATAPWASIVYVSYKIIISFIPFLGGS